MRTVRVHGHGLGLASLGQEQDRTHEEQHRAGRRPEVGGRGAERVGRARLDEHGDRRRAERDRSRRFASVIHHAIERGRHAAQARQTSNQASRLAMRKQVEPPASGRQMWCRYRAEPIAATAATAVLTT
ncbi:hypothetical protein [Catenulispora subtropica]|uniref:Uncharacterized protein n=1 Tax=Catenulispora subtropica TaxID=450798 RepID=A0ABN2T5W1_9ACTN